MLWLGRVRGCRVSVKEMIIMTAPVGIFAHDCTLYCCRKLLQVSWDIFCSLCSSSFSTWQCRIPGQRRRRIVTKDLLCGDAPPVYLIRSDVYSSIFAKQALQHLVIS